MSKAPTENVSDDHFQDAVTELPNTNPRTGSDKSSEQIVEQILEQQMGNMSMEDDTNEVFVDAHQSIEEPAIQDITENDEKIEYIEEATSEEEFQRMQKDWTDKEREANKEKSQKLKLEANELYKNDKAMEAIEIYSEALKLCPTLYYKDRAILYGNRAAAKIKVDSKKSAKDDCTAAINLWPQYVRALMRRAKLYEHEDDLDSALTDYRTVCELVGNQPEAQEACIRLTPIVKERNEKIKEECLDKLKELGNCILKPFGLSTANFQMQQDPATGSYSINFNQNPK